MTMMTQQQELEIQRLDQRVRLSEDRLRRLEALRKNKDSEVFKAFLGEIKAYKATVERQLETFIDPNTFPMEETGGMAGQYAMIKAKAGEKRAIEAILDNAERVEDKIGMEMDRITACKERIAAIKEGKKETNTTKEGRNLNHVY